MCRCPSRMKTPATRGARPTPERFPPEIFFPPPCGSSRAEYAFTERGKDSLTVAPFWRRSRVLSPAALREKPPKALAGFAGVGRKGTSLGRFGARWRVRPHRRDLREPKTSQLDGNGAETMTSSNFGPTIFSL